MNKKYRFVSLIGQEQWPIRNTFMEAWNDMYCYVQQQMTADNLPYQLLETSMWIEFWDEKNWFNTPMFFSAARDHAIDQYDWSLEKQKAQDAKA